jgi:hypothetical protein
MIIGFTGTQLSMTVPQVATLKKILTGLEITEAHHGLCVGADAQFHATLRLIDEKLSRRTRIVGHPCNLRGKQATWFYKDCDVMLPFYPPLMRNSHIVTAVERLIAAPKDSKEELRSGTWSTIRRARAMPIPITIILPDGSLA